MSSRHRLGAALLLDMPAAPEVNGLRRALGDRALDLVAPHLTLVAPVNVRAAELASALEVVRRAAYAQDGPIDLVLGPVATFLPASPVAYLAVSGPGAGSLARLQQAVSAGPLLRPDALALGPSHNAGRRDRRGTRFCRPGGAQFLRNRGEPGPGRPHGGGRPALAPPCRLMLRPAGCNRPRGSRARDHPGAPPWPRRPRHGQCPG